MITAGELIGLMEHAVGKTEARLATGHDLWQTLNRAGRALTYRRKWDWRRTGPVDLKAIGGSRTIPLPAAFGSLLSCTIDNTQDSSYTSVAMSTTQEIQRLYDFRLNPVESGSIHIAFPSYEAQRDRREEPKAVAMVFPEPESDDNPTLRLEYYKRWVELNKTDNEAVPDIPAEFESALIYLARSQAYYVEYQQESGDASLADVEIMRLTREDSGRQKHWGFMRGGAKSRARVGRTVGEATL